MARYPLEPLLSARKFREESAARNLALARRALDEARTAEARAREQLRRHREWRPGEEERLFAALRGKVLPQAELDRYRGEVHALRNAELRLEESVRDAEKAVAAGVAAVEDARRAQVAAIRDRRKIDAHKEIWLAGEAKRLAAAAEAELEDFPARAGNGGWTEEGDTGI